MPIRTRAGIGRPKKENPLPVEAEGKRVERVLGINQSGSGKKQTLTEFLSSPIFIRILYTMLGERGQYILITRRENMSSVRMV